MENKRNIIMNDISPVHMDIINYYKREFITWSVEKRQAAKIIYEVKVEDGKSYNSLFTMVAFLINPIIKILLEFIPERGYLYLAIAVILITVLLVFLWMCGRHRLYKNVALLKLLEEIDKAEYGEVIEEVNKEESDALS